MLDKPWLRILCGGLVVGTLDIVFAVSFWAARGMPPIRIFQSVAAGALGRSSSERGMEAAVLGAVLHYFIATSMVLTYFLVSRRIAVLVRRPIACGLLYGVGAYLFMQYVVIPLSAAGTPRFDVPWVVSSVVVHAALIGVPCALFARWAGRALAPAQLP